MKSLVVLGFIFSAVVSQAEVISSRVVTLPVDLSNAGIRLSSAGYSMPTVKVLIPELAAVTVMNHRNEGETAPCLATTDTFIVGDVVQGRPTVDQVPLTIELEKVVGIVNQGGTQVCSVQLVETVTGQIRGFEFSHVRSSALPSRHVDDCK